MSLDATIDVKEKNENGDLMESFGEDNIRREADFEEYVFGIKRCTKVVKADAS